MSLREELLALMQVTAVRKPRAVKTAEWGTVWVRDVTVAEIDEQDDDDDSAKAVEKAVVAKLVADGLVLPGGKAKVLLARAATRVICDESGKRVFDEHNIDDVYLLATQPWALLQAVIQDKAKEPGN